MFFFTFHVFAIHCSINFFFHLGEHFARDHWHLGAEINFLLWNCQLQWNPDFTIFDLSYSKLYGAESRFNDIRFNDIPGFTMEI